MADNGSNTPSTRLSRYRSQRQETSPGADRAPAVPAIPRDQPAQDGDIARSRSRYRRKASVADRTPVTAKHPKHEQEDGDTRPAMAAQSPPTNDARPLIGHKSQRYRRQHIPQHEPRQGSPPAQLGAQDTRQGQVDGYDSTAEHAPAGVSGRNTSRSAEPIAMKRQSPKIQIALPGPEPTGELFPPPMPEAVKPALKAMRVDGPPVSSQIKATRSAVNLPKYLPDYAPKGCFGLFKRKRSEPTGRDFEKELMARPLKADDGPAMIKAGGVGGIVPGVDAPRSAVNAGERRVMVECNNSKTLFPVTPETTAADLIKSAANCMSELIDVRSAVLVEHFGSVGVQRSIRRYEHIRDVMNSWDNDRQNSLLLVDPRTGSSETELSIAGVPQQQPGESSWLMQLSQKPGRWEKLMIVLKADGQINMQRDPNKPQSQEPVCHLSDFDIYQATPETLKRKVKPPRRFCHAIKSQQKTAMFESTSDFVHFFCTNDKETSDDFEHAVQSWRSWYLVNVMGEGQKKRVAATEKKQDMYDRSARGHKAAESFSSHYQLGSFKPLIDMDQFTESDSANDTPASQDGLKRTSLPERKASSRRKQHPPGAMANRAQLADDQKRTSIDQGRPEEFAATGLLGRSYSQRQRQVQERETRRNDPWATGPNLLNGGRDAVQDESSGRQSIDGPRRNKSTRTRDTTQGQTTNDLRRNQSRRNRSPELQRFGSRRGPAKPLVDLTPQYREPPQHVRKGKGHYPDRPGNLIESATTPEDPIGIPPSTDWRGRNCAYQQNEGRNCARSMSRHEAKSGAVRSSGDADSAFTGQGLLAHGAKGWGGENRGRGYANGSHAKGPLLNMREPSQFPQGSLLNKVERETPKEGPIIDRSGE
ncbi:hypothetical protein Tdes44962_MAKER02184 [Teratosphaeria destructans]|uniref:PH domain-containing protein n=1 Tax=Teratosphaeria destructans TaxID=418781 RepID=A0A9W7SUY2_9PEZI|nr:hypothetical protein Tdes44962_MAKER02184 [Teratosphaeria destructans]